MGRDGDFAVLDSDGGWGVRGGREEGSAFWADSGHFRVGGGVCHGEGSRCGQGRRFCSRWSDRICGYEQVVVVSR